MAGLRELAEADLKTILEDEVYGFAVDITLTNPAGVTQTLKGFSNDVSQIIDPETGQIVSARLATATLRLSSITIGTPEGIADPKSKPWLCAFDDILGNSHIFKVAQGNPDLALGVIFMILEIWKP